MGKKASTAAGHDKKLERLVTEEFQRAVRIVKRSRGRSNAAKIYDLVGPILKRRKQAAIAYIDAVRERYAALYPELALEEEWARQNCAMGHSVDGADHLYYITLAAAIWILDELKQSGRMRDALRYFADGEQVGLVRLPDMFFDPCHDESVIRGMMWLIQERDERDNPFQWHINDVSARRRGPQEVAATPDSPAETPEDVDGMTSRQRFDMVMSMIHPALKERATQRFEAKLWEFFDRYFKCASRYGAVDKGR